MNKLFRLLRNYRYYFLMFLVTSAILSYAAIFSLPAHSITEQARSVESFIDSIGVNVHLGYDNTPYMKYDEIVKLRLKELGVRHIRTNIHEASNKRAIAKVKDLSNIGIKSLIVTDPKSIDSIESVKAIEAQIEGVSMVEGANEWNINPNFRYKGQGFPQGVITFQKELYSAIKNNPATAHLNVVAPSLAHVPPVSPVSKGIEQLSGSPCDINNMHSYPAGRIPSIEYLDTVHIDGNKKLCGQDKPIIATETGYNNATKDKSGISETAAAKYINRLFLEYFNRGVQRTYTYELIDPVLNPNLAIKGQNWGLLRADGRQKREFNTIRNLIAILQNSQASTSSSSVSNSLSYDLKGDLTNIHHTLLQKENGTFYLIMWQAVDSYDRDKKIDLKVLDRKMVLLPNTKMARVNVYRPFDSVKAYKAFTNPEKVYVGVPDHAVILEIIPL